MVTSERQRWYLEAMGVDAWVKRHPAHALPDVVPAASEVGGAADSAAALDWEALETRVAACTLCELHATRTHTVFGTGNRNACWMIIGEAPGVEEDRRGEPFVGRAGLLLNEMLSALGLSREAVYIANILKCRPPGNRDPRPEEAAHCEPYLRRQVALVNPRIILAVGRIAAQNLLKTERKVGELRGRVHRYADTGIPLVVTYHPAYLLRSPYDKRKAWNDLCLAMEVANGRQPVG
jgi:uracil-DNA glycosylase